MIVPNGLAFSPDGTRMYLSDSHPNVQKIWAFDYDTDSGTPHNKRLFVDMRGYPAAPMAPPSTRMAATGSAATTPGRSTASPPTGAWTARSAYR
jgi:sugar lactone lactonase YvrE